MSTKKEATLGQVVREHRSTKGLSLKDLGASVRKEDGTGVSAQYLHDIERDRRTPSPLVLSELARALGVDPHYLSAVAGQCPPQITAYLQEYPDAAADVAALFERALNDGFVNWSMLGKKQATA